MPTSEPMKVVIAPDSFKGSLDAARVAGALAQGWRQVRPGDVVVPLPLADGGEGTLDVLAAAVPDAVWHEVAGVCGPDGRPVDAAWLLLPDGSAAVELARSSGLGLMATPDAGGATTYGLGEVIAAATRHPMTRRLLVALGGSATTDGGTGALTALGARFLDASGNPVRRGGAGLLDLASVDLAGLPPPPADGVQCLVDVAAPLLGPDGAAHQFGPQKGAGPDDVDRLERALARLAEVLGGDPAAPGSGAAGGTAYGLATGWGAELVPGAVTLAERAGLPSALADADVVITGEGAFDSQSLGGKIVGHVLGRAARADVRALVVAGTVAPGVAPQGVGTASLVAAAGSAEAAIREPARWLRAVAAELAATLD